MSAGGDEFVSVAEIAGIVKLNPQTARNWIDAGTLPAYHVGRRVRVPRSAFDAARAHRTAPISEAQQRQAQDFCEGERPPTPVIESGEGEHPR
jgi:excisionase family DNA binding protein